MKIVIEESGVRFRHFSPQECFHIERSQLYKKLQQNLKIVEFVLRQEDSKQQPSIWIVEAKSSSPKPDTNGKFDNFIGEITEKMSNAFSLLFALMLQRHPLYTHELPKTFKVEDISSCAVRFVLVLPKHPTASLVPIQQALQQTLNNTIKTWNLGPLAIAVLNEKLALRHSLIMESQETSAGQQQ